MFDGYVSLPESKGIFRHLSTGMSQPSTVGDFIQQLSSVQNPSFILWNIGWLKTGFPALGLLESPIYWVV